MKSLVDFFESKLGSKVNIYPYSSGDCVSSCAEIVSWNDEAYVVELVDEFSKYDFKGYFYLIYQTILNEEILNEVFYSLYDDIKIFNYKGNYIVNVSCCDFIDKTTPQIVELESYMKTYIMCLGAIKSTEELEFKVKLSNRLQRYIFIENSDRKYFDIYDLALYNLIDSVGCDSTYEKLFDYSLIDKLDKLVLEAGISFIENGFNIAKTSSSIYLHRNTLIYRLDKIKDILGIDIKNFNEALVYYLIVKNYLMNNK